MGLEESVGSAITLNIDSSLLETSSSLLGLIRYVGETHRRAMPSSGMLQPSFSHQQLYWKGTYISQLTSHVVPYHSLDVGFAFFSLDAQLKNKTKGFFHLDDKTKGCVRYSAIILALTTKNAGYLAFARQTEASRSFPFSTFEQEITLIHRFESFQPLQIDRKKVAGG